MPPKIVGLIFILGTLLAFGIPTSQLVSLVILILLFTCTFSLLLRGKWLPQFGTSILGLLIGPCLVAVVLRMLLAQLHLPTLPHFWFGWTGILLLLLGLVLAALISFLIVKRRLRFLQQGAAPVTNERQPVYAPRRRQPPEE